MRWTVKIALVVLAAFAAYVAIWEWVGSGTAPQWVSAGLDRATVLTGNADPHTRCYLAEQRLPSGTTLQSSLPPRRCYEWKPVRRFQGVYIDEFEGQRFIEGTSKPPPYRPNDDVWLGMDDVTDFSLVPTIVNKEDRTRVWSVKFIGRKTARPGRYGHMGSSNEEVLVDRFLSAKLLHEQDGYLPDSMLKR